jgi:hypothetical protein
MGIFISPNLITMKKAQILRILILRKTMIRDAVNTSGSYDPNENIYQFEENLFSQEVTPIVGFYQWLHDNKDTFGSATYDDKAKQYAELKGL